MPGTPFSLIAQRKGRKRKPLGVASPSPPGHFHPRPSKCGNVPVVNLPGLHPKESAVHFTACAPLDWLVRVTIPRPAFFDALEAEVSRACNPVAYADRGSKGTPLAHFFPLFLWVSKEIGRGCRARSPTNQGRRNVPTARGSSHRARASYTIERAVSRRKNIPL